MSSVTTSTVSERSIGRVKWFNNKAGYGFVTVTDGPKSGTDIFVHHSSIKVDTEQYKYLVQGEYVEFTLVETASGEHAVQAGEVSGIKGGKLMCETRRDVRVARTQYKTVAAETELVTAPREARTPRARGQGPREDGGDWKYVVRNDKDASVAKRPRGRPPKSAVKAAQ
jgi:cold shock protein